MTRHILFANRKGGCGKTTTAVNIAHALAKKRQRILLIDMDPQSHATLSLGNPSHPEAWNIVHFLKGEVSPDTVILPTHLERISLIPGSETLINFETECSSPQAHMTLLKERLTDISDMFDYVLTDPPPGAGLLMMMSLVAAHKVYIPMQMHFLNLEGLAEMIRMIYTVNARWNPDLHLGGIIPTFYNKNTRISKEISEDIITHFGEERLLPGIRLSISLAEAPGHGKTIFEYAPDSTGASDYMALAKQMK